MATEAQVQAAITAIEDITAAGLAGVGQPILAAAAIAVGELAKAIDAEIRSPSAAGVIAVELEAADAAADTAEALKFKG